MSDRDTIITGPIAFGARANTALTGAGDIVDADYVVVELAGPGDGVASVEPPAAPVAMPPLGGMDMLRRRALRSAPAKARRAGPVFWFSGTVLAVAAFWVAGGHAVLLPLMPSTEMATERGLRIASVISKVDRSGVHPVLQIDGQAVNDGDATAAMPPLAIQVVSAAGGSMRYNLGTAGSPVEGGSTFAFSSRLDMPKDGVKTVFVTFAE